jgi:crotonobetainyl-CoA:carnitine CoA-transferase CaiB-like acyl-CoA transferase
MGGDDEKALDAAWADVGRLEAENKQQAAVIEQWELDYAVCVADRDNRTKERDSLRARVAELEAECIDIDGWRASVDESMVQYERCKSERDAMRKEAFVQGYLRGSLSTKAIELPSAPDAEILALLPIADAAYVVYRKERDL